MALKGRGMTSNLGRVDESQDVQGDNETHFAGKPRERTNSGFESRRSSTPSADGDFDRQTSPPSPTIVE